MSTIDISILAAEDNYYSRLLLNSMFKEIGVRKLVVVENGQELINALRNEAFDLILLDIEMPVMNGMETAQMIKNQPAQLKRKAKVWAFTAFNPDDFFESEHYDLFDDILLKPLQHLQFLEIFKKHFPDKCSDTDIQET